MARRGAIFKTLVVSRTTSYDDRPTHRDLEQYGPPPRKGETAKMVARGADVLREAGWIYEVLEAHEALRKQHGAAPLKWSRLCAERAQRLADEAAERGKLVYPDNYQYGHGVNCFAGTVGAHGAADIVKAWHHELWEPGFAWPADSAPSEGSANFSQVVWRDTLEVGMACDRRGLGFVYADYWPRGNIPGLYGLNVLPLGTPEVGRSALNLADGVVGNNNMEVIASWPGTCENQWNQVVGIVELMRLLDPNAHYVSSACQFLPEGDPAYGQHCENDIDGTKECFCHKIYGSRKPWGCRWFDLWRKKLHEALRRGQRPVVVYKARQVSEGDRLEWRDLPAPRDPDDDRGLGQSQKAEVAYLKKLVGDGFVKRDVRHITRETQQLSWRRIKESISGVDGCRKFADAVLRCPAAHESFKSIDVSNAQVGLNGARALGQVLPQLHRLERLNLADNDLGSGGVLALVRWLPVQLPRMTELVLSGNDIRREGALVLAKVLPRMPALKELWLNGNSIGPTGASVVANVLQEMPHLENLGLCDNIICPRGTKALSAVLPQLPYITGLMLGGNSIGPDGIEILAPVLPELRFLSNLDLSCNGLGDTGAEALASALNQLGKLQTLDLGENDFGPFGGEAIAESLHLLPIRALWLGGNNIGEIGATALARELPDLKEVRHLGLGNNNLGAKGGPAICRALANMSLTTLWLQNNGFGDLGAASLAEVLPQIRGLQRLVLSGNGVGDDGAASLAEGLRGTACLQRMLLEKNNIGAAGQRALRGVRPDLF